MGKARQKVGRLGPDAAALALELAPGAAEHAGRAPGFAVGSVMWICDVDPLFWPRGRVRTLLFSSLHPAPRGVLPSSLARGTRGAEHVGVAVPAPEMQRPLM